MLCQGPGEGPMLSHDMLIHDFVQVGRNFGEIRAQVLADPRALIATSAGAAYREGERIVFRLTPSSKHPRFRKTIDVDIGAPYEREDQVVVPMHWWAPGATRLYPHLDADLEFAPLGAFSTHITLMGSYDPPLGAVGRRADVILLHRVVEASVRSFLTRVSRSLEQPMRPRVASG